MTTFRTVLDKLAAEVQQGSTQLPAINRGSGRVFNTDYRQCCTVKHAGLGGGEDWEGERTGRGRRPVLDERESTKQRSWRPTFARAGYCESYLVGLWSVLPGLPIPLAH